VILDEAAVVLVNQRRKSRRHRPPYLLAASKMSGAPRSGYRRTRPTRWLAPNRYDSMCIRCNQLVPAGTGWFRFDGVRWVVSHPAGQCHSVGYTQYISDESAAWEQVRRRRLEFAKNQCEWRSFSLRRCLVGEHLQCHHRHYHTLGSERLSDVIMLCKPHHNLADRRRKQFGAWPLIGRPILGSRKPIVTAQSMVPQMVPTSGNVSFCATCGRPVSTGDRFCTACGSTTLQKS